MDQTRQLDNPITLRIGPDEIIIRRRYEFASIANDFLIGVLFLVGSVMFLSTRMEELGTWLFIIGSFQLLIRPTIRLASHVHLQRIPSSGWES